MDPPLQSGNLANVYATAGSARQLFQEKGLSGQGGPILEIPSRERQKEGKLQNRIQNRFADEVCGTTLLINWTINITSSCATRTLAEKTTAVERSRERDVIVLERPSIARRKRNITFRRQLVPVRSQGQFAPKVNSCVGRTVSSALKVTLL